jgi:methylthioribose-1-phosphate isomerase
MLDQRILPHQQSWISYSTANSVAEGIRDMVVRGAPAIGIAAAYGMALARCVAGKQADCGEFILGFRSNQRP